MLDGPCSTAVMPAYPCWVWLQGDLHVLVPWLLVALADLKSSNPALAGRLKVAAMQLLPPLLDGLHARRLARLSDGEGSAKRQQPQPQPESSFNTWVGTVAALPGACILWSSTAQADICRWRHVAVAHIAMALLDTMAHACGGTNVAVGTVVYHACEKAHWLHTGYKHCC